LLQAGRPPIGRIEYSTDNCVVASATDDRGSRNEELEWRFDVDDGDEGDARFAHLRDVGRSEMNRFGVWLESAKRVESGGSNQVWPSNRSERSLRTTCLFALAARENHFDGGADVPAVEPHGNEPNAGFSTRTDGLLQFDTFAAIELRNRDNSMIELEPEHGVRDCSHVAHGLLGGFRVVREHVHFNRPPAAIPDDAYGEHANQPRQLVFEFPQLRAGVRVRFASGACVAVRPVTRHRGFVPPGAQGPQ
jgi:hypothetical protein